MPCLQRLKGIKICWMALTDALTIVSSHTISIILCLDKVCIFVIHIMYKLVFLKLKWMNGWMKMCENQLFILQNRIYNREMYNEERSWVLGLQEVCSLQEWKWIFVNCILAYLSPSFYRSNSWSFTFMIIKSNM